MTRMNRNHGTQPMATDVAWSVSPSALATATVATRSARKRTVPGFDGSRMADTEAMM